MRHHLVLTLSLLLALAGVACSKKAAPPKIAREQLLRVNINGEPATMDPRKGGDLVSSAMHFMLFEGLTRLNPDGTVSLAQAESVDLSEDRMTYTFHLRETWWSDGSKVTAQDFENSWKDILDPSFPAPSSHLLYPIKNAEKAKKGLLPLSAVGIVSKDAKTLVVSLESPTAYFLELVSFCVFFPVNKKIDEHFPKWAYSASAHFVSNGPFTLTSWKHNNEIVVKKNPTYWAKKEVGLDTIHISMIDNEMTALKMYENGDLDILGLPLSPLPVDASQDLARKKKLQTKPVAATTFVTFNIHQIPFNNTNVRKAFAYAINREAIIENITQLDEQIATGAVPPILKNNKVTEFFKDADIAKARLLFQMGLEELGITASELKELPYLYDISDMSHKVAQALQQQWHEVLGVKVKLEAVEYKVLMDRLAKHQYVFAHSRWIAQYSDQMNILERFKFKENIKNQPGWENEEYISLLNQSALDKTPEQRLETLEKAEALFMDEMPLAPLFHWNYAFLTKSYVKNFYIQPIGDIAFEKISIDHSP